MLSQPVTKDFVLHQLDKLSSDRLAEVARFIESLQFRTRVPLRESVSGEHAAFGIWADYPEADEPAIFALKLRRQIETRQDAATNTPD
ncbi:MAG: hypothetical protein KKD28_15205 [Chloroflexi bacterium]|nr:hypothetical protein [Chloroflexota bacterium]MBU1662807.1 hypothetical protein [Chloroflexota bacterium]